MRTSSCQKELRFESAVVCLNYTYGATHGYWQVGRHYLMSAYVNFLRNADFAYTECGHCRRGGRGLASARHDHHHAVGLRQWPPAKACLATHRDSWDGRLWARCANSCAGFLFPKQSGRWARRRRRADRSGSRRLIERRRTRGYGGRSAGQVADYQRYPVSHAGVLAPNNRHVRRDLMRGIGIAGCLRHGPVPYCSPL